MKHKMAWLIIPVLLVTGLLPGGQLAAAPARNPAAAPQGTPFLSAAFQRVWTRTDKLVADRAVGRSWYWGPEANTATQEYYKDAPGGTRLVQYFDKSRMEINNPAGNPNDPFFVTNGLLVVEMISGRMQVGNNDYEQRTSAEVNVSGDFNDPDAPTYKSLVGVSNTPLGDHPAQDRSGQRATATINRGGTVGDDPAKASVPKTDFVHFDTTTKHNIPSAFWNFLNEVGPIVENGQTHNGQLNTPWYYASGLPISEPYWARVRVAGNTIDVLIQAFERRVLTYTPQNPPAFQVEMGNVGAHYRDWRYIGPGAVGNPLTGPHVGYGFGVELYYTNKDAVLQKVKEAGFSWVRQQVPWADIQDQNTRAYLWGELDSIVEAAQRNNVKLILSLVKAPSWAARNGRNGMPGDKFDFGSFAANIARHYKGKVAAYEIWNEQNLQSETGAPVNPAQYLDLLVTGYSSIKWIDPQAVVIYGGETPTGVNNPDIGIDDVIYLQQFYQLAGGAGKRYFDVLGAHPGSNLNPPDTLWPSNPGPGCSNGNQWCDHPSFYFRRIEGLRQVMEANGDGGKQMWLTEFGWTTRNSAPGYEYGQYVTDQNQADYLVRAFQKGKNDYSWMGVMTVWNLNLWNKTNNDADEKAPWSVLDKNLNARPSYTALKNMPK
jgi:hypothetical protein